MIKIKSRREGFSVVELVIAVFIVVAIGLVGVLVAAHPSKKPITLTTTSSKTNKVVSSYSPAAAPSNSTPTSPTPQKSLTTSTSKASTLTTKPSTSSTAPASSPSSSTSSSPVSYDTIINQFISDIQSGNKSSADSLEDSGLQQSIKNSSGTTSFYDACKTVGSDCENAFSAAYLASAAGVTTQTYTSSWGAGSGEMRVYTINSSSCNAQYCGGVTDNVYIGVVPSGNSWLVDHLAKSGNAFPGQ